MKASADRSSRVSKAAIRDKSRSNLRAQGLRTRKMIVRAATRLLLQSGGLDFTMRAVSREAKISVSNLQYYFPNRSELLRAVMAPVIEAYLLDLERVLKSDVSPREILDGITERTVEDAQNIEKMTLQWHFATLATVDSECSRLYDEWYEALVRGVAHLLARVNPGLGSGVSVQFAMLLIAMADGLGFQMRAGRKKTYTRELGESYRAMIDFLVRNNPLSPQKVG